MTILPASQIPSALSTDWLSTVPMEEATGQPQSSDSLSSAQTNGKLCLPYFSAPILFVIGFVFGRSLQVLVFALLTDALYIRHRQSIKCSYHL